ncbi:hypothetical protein [Nocardiopsis valliformis]|uniref:hypothetical protein n=1 Tax=Nocardiopsis valliformis TaxID=239974 RepID=UPI001268DD90|nr:hypothetical protein [Nocardiopsis valliformis]
MTSPPTLHPWRPLRTPQGAQVPIDEDLVPLITRLWELGIRTRSSCQDYGAMLAASPPGLAAGDRRWIDFCADRAWLELETEDAERLVGLVSRDPELRLALSQWGLTESWWCVRPLLPELIGGRGKTAPSAHLLFPREHLERVVNVLRETG